MKKLIYSLSTLILLPYAVFAQVESIEASLEGSATYIVKDPMQRKTGRDLTKNITFSEIPDASYGTGGVDSEDPRYPGIVSEEFGVSKPMEGEYSIRVVGYSLGRFDLVVVVYRGHYSGKDTTFKGLVNKGQESEFLVRFVSDTTQAVIFRKTVGAKNLRNDIDNAYELHLLGKKLFYDDLIHRMDKFDDFLVKRDSTKARHELQKLMKKILEVHQKTVREEEKKENRGKAKSKTMRQDPFIVADAFNILTEDINSLLDRLPLSGKKEKLEEGED